MEPLIFIVAAGEGKRLYPETKDSPKSFLDVGNKKLIDLVMEQLPNSIEKVVLLKKADKFKSLERHLKEEYSFRDRNILYQDKITGSPYLPRSITTDALLILGYLAGHFPPLLSKNSRLLQQYDPVLLVPGDILVKDLDYLDLTRTHTANEADVTMVMKQDFVEGSNTRIWRVKDGRIVEASDYVHPPLERQLEADERLYTHEGTWVLGQRFFNTPLYRVVEYLLSRGFAKAFAKLKFVPYEVNFDWIDVRDHQNLIEARRRFG